MNKKLTIFYTCAQLLIVSILPIFSVAAFGDGDTTQIKVTLEIENIPFFDRKEELYECMDRDIEGESTLQSGETDQDPKKIEECMREIYKDDTENQQIKGNYIRGGMSLISVTSALMTWAIGSAKGGKVPCSSWSYSLMLVAGSIIFLTELTSFMILEFKTKKLEDEYQLRFGENTSKIKDNAVSTYFPNALETDVHAEIGLIEKNDMQLYTLDHVRRVFHYAANAERIKKIGAEIALSLSLFAFIGSLVETSRSCPTMGKTIVGLPKIETLFTGLIYLFKQLIPTANADEAEAISEEESEWTPQKIMTVATLGFDGLFLSGSAIHLFSRMNNKVSYDKKMRVGWTRPLIIFALMSATSYYLQNLLKIVRKTEEQRDAIGSIINDLCEQNEDSFNDVVTLSTVEPSTEEPPPPNSLKKFYASIAEQNPDFYHPCFKSRSAPKEVKGEKYLPFSNVQVDNEEVEIYTKVLEHINLIPTAQANLNTPTSSNMCFSRAGAIDLKCHCRRSHSCLSFTNTKALGKSFMNSAVKNPNMKKTLMELTELTNGKRHILNISEGPLIRSIGFLAGSITTGKKQFEKEFKKRNVSTPFNMKKVANTINLGSLQGTELIGNIFKDHPMYKEASQKGMVQKTADSKFSVSNLKKMFAQKKMNSSSSSLLVKDLVAKVKKERTKMLASLDSRHMNSKYKEPVQVTHKKVRFRSIHNSPNIAIFQLISNRYQQKYR
ncbi:hypothetical protein OAB57_01435 [Bacteriovoracaceae bacterium]|nr:hypothetical protein [Bacteriovoracaceae bacterium]